MERVIDPSRYCDDLKLPYIVGYSRANTQWKFHCIKCNSPLFLYIRTILPANWETIYYDPECFWRTMRAGSNQISLDLIYGIDTLDYEDQVKLIEEVEKYQVLCKVGVGLGRRYFQKVNPSNDIQKQQRLLILGLTKVVVSSRQKYCGICKKLFKVQSLAISFMKEDVHPSCAFDCDVCFGTIEEITGYNALSNSQKKILLRDAQKIPTGQEFKQLDNIIHLSDKQRVLVFSIACFCTFPPNLPFVPIVKCCRCEKVFSRTEFFFLTDNQPFHTECLFKTFSIIFDTPEDLPNWNLLPAEVKKRLRLLYDLACRSENTVAMTFPRFPNNQNDDEIMEVSIVNDKELPTAETLRDDRLRKEQVEQLGKLRRIVEHQTDDFKTRILQHNNQPIASEMREKIEHIIDIIYFGVPAKCLQCKGSIVYNLSRRIYFCTGYVYTFEKCDFESKNPPRVPFAMPNKLRENLFNFPKQDTRLYAGERYGQSNTTLSQGLPPEIYELCTQKTPFDKMLSSDHKRSYIVVQGSRVPETLPNAENYHVVSVNGELMDCCLVNVEYQHNRNTCVMMFLLETDCKEGPVSIFKETFRIGMAFEKATIQEILYKEKAIEQFKKQFFDMTGLQWENRNSQIKIVGRFMYLPTTREKMIDHFKRLEFVIKELTTTKAPLKFQDLHRCSTYSHLGVIEERLLTVLLQAMKNFQNQLNSQTENPDQAVQMTNLFFSFVPIATGIGSHELANSFSKMTNLNRHLQKVAFPFLRNGAEDHPTSAMCNEWKFTLKLLVPGMKEYELVKKCALNSIGPSHNAIINLMITDIIEFRKLEDESESIKKTMLWCSIEKSEIENLLRNGEISLPKRSEEFGSGIHLVECISKAILCQGHSDSIKQSLKQYNYVVFCEFKGGKMREIFDGYDEQEVTTLISQKGYNSIHYCGRFSSDPSEVHKLGNVHFYTGELCKLKDRTKYTPRLYDQFLTFDSKRVKPRFLVRVKCSLKSDPNSLQLTNTTHT